MFEGLGWLLRGMAGAVGLSAFCAVMTGLELVGVGGRAWGDPVGGKVDIRR
jgi:hypothetical protein